MLLKTLYDASYSVVQGVGARRVGDVRRVGRCRGPTRRKIPISTVVGFGGRGLRGGFAAPGGKSGGFGDKLNGVAQQREGTANVTLPPKGMPLRFWENPHQRSKILSSRALFRTKGGVAP